MVPKVSDIVFLLLCFHWAPFLVMDWVENKEWLGSGQFNLFFEANGGLPVQEILKSDRAGSYKFYDESRSHIYCR